MCIRDSVIHIDGLRFNDFLRHALLHDRADVLRLAGRNDLNIRNRVLGERNLHRHAAVAAIRAALIRAGRIALRARCRACLLYTSGPDLG